MSEILIIQNKKEDQEKILGLLEGFSPDNSDFVVTSTLDEALARIRATDFELIISDMDLQDSKGKDTINSILEIEKRSPVVLLTSKKNEELAMESIGFGIQDCLIKWDFDQSQLFKCLKSSIKRKEAEEKVRVSQEKLKTIFDSAPLGFFLTDMKGTFVDGNKAAEKILGYYNKEFLGKSYLDVDIISPEDRDKAIQLLVRNSIGMSTGPDKLVFKRKTGEDIKVELFTNSIQINNEVYAFGIAREIHGMDAAAS